IQYIYSNRLNLGTVRSEENVFWSFAPHDISLFQFFSKSFPSDIYSTGGDFLQKNIHDTTITYIKYPNGIQGHIYVSWLHPFKEHRLVLIGSKGSLHFEDSGQNKPLLFYEKDETKDENMISIKNKMPKKIEYDSSLPLENELKYFIEIIRGDIIKKAGIDEGINVVKILEIASKSLNLNKI
ncbi:MAG: Gfo/Idh/MocA family oxidoreductase, partial [Candidatus Neomarinimicrobiota bacterium]